MTSAEGVRADAKSYVCIHVFDSARPVLCVTRPDGDWCFLCGDDPRDDPAFYRVVHLGHAIAGDPTLRDVLDLGPNEEAERSAVGAEWVRSSF